MPKITQVVLSLESKPDVLAKVARTLADAKLAAIGELASGVAHEVNNPLMVVMGQVGP